MVGKEVWVVRTRFVSHQIGEPEKMPYDKSGKQTARIPSSSSSASGASDSSASKSGATSPEASNSLKTTELRSTKFLCLHVQAQNVSISRNNNATDTVNVANRRRMQDGEEAK